jgi:hypothetical protein
LVLEYIYKKKTPEVNNMAKTVAPSSGSKKVSGGKNVPMKGKASSKKPVMTKTQFEAPKKKGPKGLWIIPLIAFLVFLWMLALKLDLYKPFYFNANDQVTVWVGAGIQLAFVVVLSLVYMSKNKFEEEKLEELKKTYVAPEEKVGATSDGGEVDGEELLEVEPEVVEDEDVAAPPVKTVHQSLEDKEHGIVEYPPQITGGIYSDSLIPVGKGKLLKLRTIIARSCLICDKQVECWPKARRVVSKEDFKSNIECKGGLRRLGVKDI